MSLIGKKVSDFKVKAFHNGEFIDVTREDLKGKWSVSSSTRQTSPSSVPLSWATWPTTMTSSRR